MKKEFVPRLHRFLLNCPLCDSDELEELIAVAMKFKIDP
jgi:hypothetical protein